MEAFPTVTHPDSTNRFPRLRYSILFCFLLFASLEATAGPLITNDTSVAFFTNLASRLLQSELNLNLGHIQIYPTNQYTPAVHRLLQVSANIHDAVSDRSFGFKNPTGYPTPSFPTIFQPLFQSINAGNEVYIVGFRELTNLDILTAITRDLSNPNERANLRQGDMVYGFPLVIAAAKGIPNFNEFGLLTRVDVLRLLEFRRPDGDPNLTKVNETNQMYIVGVSNVFGVEAWNSYSNTYPRNLRLIWAADMTAVMTNEFTTVLLSNRVSTGNVITVTANAPYPNGWPGWVSANFALTSFKVPTYTNFPFLTNATYRQNPVGFVPQTHIFERTFQNPDFKPPHFLLSLNSRVRMIMVDDDAQRIVDYVNLNNTADTIDVFSKLAQSASCSMLTPATYLNAGSHWCTNVPSGQTPPPPNEPTYGILNQILLGLNGGSQTVGSFSQDLAAGSDANKAVDGFRYNLLGWGPIHNYGPVPPTFYKSNVFYVPFSPYTPILVQNTWQANDPLVHYTVGDLVDLGIDQSNIVQVIRQPLPMNYMVLPNIGAINGRYKPWGGNPFGPSSPNFPVADRDLAAKDPDVYRPDDWDFPINQSLPNLALGRIHRGTPWQTLYLKSASIDPLAWQRWVGIADPHEAALLQPTNDWHLASLLTTLFSDRDPRTLSSANQLTTEGWEGLLNGTFALTNIAWSELNFIRVYSNSPQAATVATAITAQRQTQPAQLFSDFGDILAAPELSVASPWLNLTDFGTNFIDDTAYEIIPSQLLRRLRQDSIGSLSFSGNTLQVQFSGFDGYAYAVQSSSNLLNWVSVSTNNPTNGSFTYLSNAQVNPGTLFFRSVLLP